MYTNFLVITENASAAQQDALRSAIQKLQWAWWHQMPQAWALKVPQYAEIDAISTRIHAAVPHLRFLILGVPAGASLRGYGPTFWPQWFDQVGFYTD